MKRIEKTALLLILLLLAALAVGSAYAEEGLWTDVSSEEELLTAIDAGALRLRMTQDIPLDTMLKVDGRINQGLVLDMNGHSLSRQLDAHDYDGHVIYVSTDGQISIINSDPEHRGIITGGWASDGGGIINYGNVSLSGITLTGNTADSPSDTAQGSAIKNHGMMHLEDVVVTGNTVMNDTKGSDVYNDGVMYVNNVVIENNTGGSGGGLRTGDNLYASGRLVLSGETGDHLSLYSSAKLNFNGPITADSRISIDCAPDTVFTSGYKEHVPDLSPDTVFFPLDETLHVCLQNEEAISRAVIPYVERSWNGERVVAVTKECVDYIPIRSGTAGLSLGDGWYVVRGETAVYGSVEIRGDVHLIICDGSSLDVQGNIHVCTGNANGSLTVYAQFGDSSYTLGEGSGTIAAHSARNDTTAIGGSSREATGPITIHGGQFYAYCLGSGAPGIGSGPNAPSGTEQPITIYGGTIYAMGGSKACGIGNGANSSGVRLNIYGGWVLAIAASEGYPGFSVDDDPSSAIENMFIPGNFKVTYQGSETGLQDAPGAQRELYAQTNQVAIITACDHAYFGLHSISDEEHAIMCPSCTLVESRSAHILGDIQIDQDRHYAVCEACGAQIGTAHDFGENNLCACSAHRIHVTFMPGEGSGEAFTLDVTTQADFALPESPFTASEDKWFAGWRKTGSSRLYMAGQKVKFTEAEDVTFTASWSDMTWAVLQSRIDAADNTAEIVLSSDVIATAEDGPLTIPFGKTITLELGQYTLNRNLSEPADDGGVIAVEGTLTLRGSGAATVTGGNTTDAGGGIYVNYGGKLTVEGCLISGNHADFVGGAIADMGGEILLKGNTRISENTAGYAGGGVAMISGSLDMSQNVTVTQNTSDFVGGGVAVLNNSSFAIKDSIEICANRRRVESGSDSELKDDDIYLGEGNVMTLRSKVTKEKPYVITTEVLSEHGKPVFITAGFGDNVFKGFFDSTRAGEEVELDEYTGEAMLTTGMVDVRFLPGSGTGEEQSFRTPDGTQIELPGNEYSYVPPEGTTFSGWHRTGEAMNVIHRPGEKILLDGDVEFVARYAYKWSYLQELFNQGGTIVLQGDTIAEASDTYLDIPSGVKVDLDLNGFSIDRNMQRRDAFGCVIHVGGELILRDSSPAQTGTITGGWLYRSKETVYRSGSAFDINGKLTMYGGNITGNRDESISLIHVNGGAQFVMYGGSIHDNRDSVTVYVGGSFSQYGGEIRNNTSDVTTVAVRGSTLLAGGSVSHNTSYGYGGAYTIYEEGLTISGGEIVGNKGDTGGAVAHWIVSRDRGAAIKLSGSPIIEDNTYGGRSGDICLRQNTYYPGLFSGFQLVGPLGKNVRIGVRFVDDSTNRVITQGLPGNGVLENFYNNAGGAVALNEAGEAVMGTSAAVLFDPGEGGTGKMPPMVKVVGMKIILPECGFTPPEGMMFVAWKNDEGSLFYPGEQLVAQKQMTLTAVWARSKWQQLQYQLELARGGVVKLPEDLVADESLGDAMLVVTSGMNAILDLNGHTLDRAPVGNDDQNGVFSVEGSLTIRDSSQEQTGRIIGAKVMQNVPAIRNTGTLTIEGGTFDGFRTLESGAVIQNEGTLTIKGGTFQNNETVEAGGVILNEGTLNVSGGTFENNTAGTRGGAIQNEDTLTISGGTIRSASAAYGGGICNTPDGTATISGGTIDACQATQSGAGIWNGGALAISGGSIQNNRLAASEANGAGIWTGGTLELTGGTITGNVCAYSGNHGGGIYIAGSRIDISGSPDVAMNSSADGEWDDIFLTEATILNVTGALTADAHLGVRADRNPTMDKPIVITRGLPGMGTVENFFSDDPMQQPLGSNNDNELVFGAPVVISFLAAEGDDSSGGMDDIYTALGATITVPDYGYPMPANKKFVGWEINGVYYYPGEKIYVTPEVMGRPDVSALATWEATAWTALQTWLDATHSGVYVMTEDVTALPGEGPLIVPDTGAAVTIDLNGHTIDRGLSAPVVDGSALIVEGSLTIVDSSADKSGVITGGNNTAAGGGILNNGTLTISGGTITGNSAQEAGAVYNSSGAVLTITDGTYKNNTAVTFGGGALINYGTMTMSGGTVTGNTAKMNGGGIWTNGTLTLTGGTITGNTLLQSTGNGGGIYYRGGTFNIGGEPVIAENNKNNLYLLNGLELAVISDIGKSANIHVCTESAPTARTPRIMITQGLPGKGLASSFVSDSDEYLILSTQDGEATATSFVEIRYDSNGGAGSAQYASLQPIPGNYTMRTDNPFTAPAGKLFAGWEVGGRVYDPGETFSVDPAKVSCTDIVVKAVWASSDWEALKLRLAGGGVKSITLTKDIIAPESERVDSSGILSIPKDADITIDLNGHTISRGLTRETCIRDGNVLTINGTLTLKDTSEAQTGRITGGASIYNSGCIYMDDYGKLNMYGGSITGNYTQDRAGAIYMPSQENVFNMYGGSISGNASDWTAGAIRMWSCTFNMYGGSITGNVAQSDGGAFYLVHGATFNMYGGSITGNRSVDGKGGAFYLRNEGVFINQVNLHGGEISGNSALYVGGIYMDNTMNVSGDAVVCDNIATSSGTQSNVYLKPDNATIRIDGPLDSGARIGITVNSSHAYLLTEGLPGNGTRENFVSDVKGCNIWINENGEAEIGQRSFLMFDPGEGGSGTMPDIVIDNGKTILMPECTFTAPEGKQFLCWMVDDGTIRKEGEEYLPTKISTVTAIWDVAPATPWAELQRMIDVSSGTGSIVLRDDITAQPSEEALRVPSGLDLTIDLNGHTIDRNLTAARDAGSVFIIEGGTLTIQDTSAGETGMITGGRTTGSGGGVRVSSGTLNLQGGAICGNVATNSWGGGVYLYSDNSVLNLSGGVIRDNTADRNGGGVHVSELAGLNVFGRGVVQGNTVNGAANNANLASGTFVHVTGKLEKTAKICISSSVAPTSDGPVALTEGFAGNGALSNFESDRADGLIKLASNGEAGLCLQIRIGFQADEAASGSMADVTYGRGEEIVLPEPSYTAPAGKVFGGWQINDSLELYDAGESFSVEDERFDLQVNRLTAMWSTSEWAALNMRMARATQGPLTVRLTKDVTALSGDEALSVPAGTTVTLDLNGHTLDRGLSSPRIGGQVIAVSGTLNLVDTSQTQTGKITGGHNYGYGGGISVVTGGCLNMYGGTITGNRADNDLLTTHDPIAGCGGGVHIFKDACMNMYGGTVTGNSAKNYSAGIMIDRVWTHGWNNAVFTVGGSAKIYGNGTIDLNVSSDAGERLGFNGPLNNDARISVYINNGSPTGDQVAFFTQGLAGNGRIDAFTSGDRACTIVLGANGEAAVVRKQEFAMSGFEIPPMLTEIEEGAFEGLPMDSVYFPNSCQRIGAGAFRDCSNLKRVSLPKNCKIDDTAFDGTANQIWLYVPRGGTTHQWAEQYALTHNCIVYPTDD